MISRNDFQGQAKSDALSGIVPGITAPIERLEYVFYFFLWNTDSPVFYIKNDLLLLPVESHIYFFIRVFAGVIYYICLLYTSDAADEL